MIEEVMRKFLNLKHLMLAAFVLGIKNTAVEFAALSFAEPGTLQSRYDVLVVV